MTATVEMQSDYRNLPILNLNESPANPNRTFDETALTYSEVQGEDQFQIHR